MTMYCPIGTSGEHRLRRSHWLADIHYERVVDQIHKKNLRREVSIEMLRIWARTIGMQGYPARGDSE